MAASFWRPLCVLMGCLGALLCLLTVSRCHTSTVVYLTTSLAREAQGRAVFGRTPRAHRPQMWPRAPPEPSQQTGMRAGRLVWPGSLTDAVPGLLGEELPSERSMYVAGQGPWPQARTGYSERGAFTNRASRSRWSMLQSEFRPWGACSSAAAWLAAGALLLSAIVPVLSRALMMREVRRPSHVVCAVLLDHCCSRPVPGSPARAPPGAQQVADLPMGAFWGVTASAHPVSRSSGRPSSRTLAMLMASSDRKDSDRAPVPDPTASSSPGSGRGSRSRRGSRRRRSRSASRGPAGPRPALSPAAVQARTAFADAAVGAGISYDAELPICQMRDAIADAVRAHPVVVLCGETGCGKSTQMPKICLGLGRGRSARIGLTQPRRLAARALAKRIATELATGMGEGVGYRVRFQERVSPGTCIQLMTDGVLLAALARDRLLQEYDTLIIDEAHERSLNIDLLLGYLKRVLPQRPDLKVIVMSATIDADRIAAHFGGAPVLQVPGRQYPVKVRYQRGPPDTSPAAIKRALDRLAALEQDPGGDTLVFLPGESHIREAAAYLREHAGGGPEVLPLHARLSAAEQDCVLRPRARGGRRRVILATNVAETSVTVPGVRHVIDSGLVRMARYSAASGVQALQVEAISQASARQRTGRCGRVAPGVCIRLYTHDDFRRRPPFTDPEIRRENLAAVVLQVLSLGLGPVQTFPFLDPPQTEDVAAALQQLQHLQAVDADGGLTARGQRLARLPVDPQLAAMLLAAADNGCLREVLVIAAALGVQDPRERPAAQAELADAAHASFGNPDSDFMAMLNMWDFYQRQRADLRGRRLQESLRARFLSPVRLQEWHDLHAQLQTTCRSLQLRVAETPASYAALHTALLTGLPTHMGLRQPPKVQYLGCGGRRFRIHPTSSVRARQTPPDWLLGGAFVETAQVYATSAARIEPAWVEAALPHLVRATYGPPAWDPAAACVTARAQIHFFGLPLATDRIEAYGDRHPERARDIYLRDGLVAAGADGGTGIAAHNAAVVGEAAVLAVKGRSPEAVPDLVVFYDEQVPRSVFDPAALATWCASPARRSALLLDGAPRALQAVVTPAAFPDVWQYGRYHLPLTYVYEPGAESDGVTLTVPLSGIQGMSVAAIEWLVPGYLRWKVSALLDGLPWPLSPEKRDGVTAAVAALPPSETPLVDAVVAAVERAGPWPAPARPALQAVPLAAHLRMRVRVVDAEGGEMAAGRDVAALQGRFGAVRVPADYATRGLVDWSFGEWPAEGVHAQRDMVCPLYPALVDRGDAVDLTGLADPAAAWGSTCDALVRLASLAEGRVVAELTAALAGANGAWPSPPEPEPRRPPPGGGHAPVMTSYEQYEFERFVESTLARQAPASAETRSSPGSTPSQVPPPAPPSAPVARPESAPGLRPVYRGPQAQGADAHLAAVLATVGDLQITAADFVWRLYRDVYTPTLDAHPLPRSEPDFRRWVAAGRDELRAKGAALAAALQESARLHDELMGAITWLEYCGAVDDMCYQLESLFPADLLVRTPTRHLLRLPRYLRAVEARLAGVHEPHDSVHQERVAEYWRRYEQLQGALGNAPGVVELRWAMEEYRVALFAPDLAQPNPMTAETLDALIAKLEFPPIEASGGRRLV